MMTSEYKVNKIGTANVKIYRENVLYDKILFIQKKRELFTY
jgi:hypothetical protein